MAFPAGEYTPFGYLRNPGHRARSWQDTRGGNLRTSLEQLGLEWVYPTQRRPSHRLGLAFEVGIDAGRFRSREELRRAGVRLVSRYHSALIFGFDWEASGVEVSARLFLHAEDAVCLRLEARNAGPQSHQVRLLALGLAASGDAALRIEPLGLEVALLGEPLVEAAEPVVHAALAAPGSVESAAAATLAAPSGNAAAASVASSGRAPAAAAAAAPGAAMVPDASADALLLGPGESCRLRAVLARGPDREVAAARAQAALAELEATYARTLAEDAAFYATCPTLDGDWPADWRAGLVYDFETTRLLLQPPGGVFSDVWPAWMVSWPRVVLAEGTLDMLRLAYADPHLAQRAVLSLFRDAAQPNVPCVFFDGTPNMVAGDGSICGTSPAWCLPFLNLELLYLRTLDRAWLRELYPYLGAYVDWWLAHRRDADGWIVYKCTWEAGEDGNPRLDPSGSGDADISRRLRPVELQATLAHAAGVLALFASELGERADAQRWRRLRAAYRRRTQRLFDPQAGRYRDWVLDVPPEPPPPYWGVDTARWSALGLTPLLLGLPLAAEEVWLHACPPWSLWPSWTYALVESAAAAGLFAPLGELVADLLDRVYRVTTRHTLDELPRPLPGASPEFWPLDWQSFDGSDAYGWGATTANLLIRHLFGFKESRRTNGWVAELVPALPSRLLRPGSRYTLRRLTYRGLLFDLTYVVTGAGLRAELDLDGQLRRCRLRQLEGSRRTEVWRRPAAQQHHAFPLHVGQRYELELH